MYLSLNVLHNAFQIRLLTRFSSHASTAVNLVPQQNALQQRMHTFLHNTVYQNIVELDFMIKQNQCFTSLHGE